MTNNASSEQDTAGGLASVLRTLIADGHQRVVAWNAIPERVEAFKLCLDEPVNDVDDTSILEIQRDVAIWLSRTNDGKLKMRHAVSFSELPDFGIALEKIEVRELRRGNRLTDRLFTLLHSLLSVVRLAVGLRATFPQRVERALAQTRSLHDESPARIEAEASLLELNQHLDSLSDDFDAQVILYVLRRIQTNVLPLLTSPMPPSVSFLRGQTRPLTHRWHVLIVEDDQIWADLCSDAVRLTAEHLGFHWTLIQQVKTNRDDALDAIRNFVETQYSPTAAAGGGEPIGLVVLLDMGLPTGPGETATLRKNGLEVLAAARGETALSSRLNSRRANVPVIVMTTPGLYKSDQQACHRLGVRDYLLKGPEAVSELSETLARVLRHSPRLTITRPTANGVHGLVYLGRVAVPLRTAPLALLDVLIDDAQKMRDAGLAPTEFSAIELLERLNVRASSRPNSTGGEVSVVSTDLLEENRRSHWHTARAATDKEAVPVVAALKWLLSERTGVYRSLVDMARDVGIQDDVVALASYLEARFETSPTLVPAKSLLSVKDRVSELRAAVRTAFNLSGLSVQPEFEVLATVRDANGEYRYRLVADLDEQPQQFEGSDEEYNVQFESLQAAGDTVAPTRVLVVENDVELWQRPIAATLEEAGYIVDVASTVREAVNVARDTNPEVLVLDLHLPEDANAFLHDTHTIDGGLRVLEEVRKFIPNVGAVVFSGFAEDDLLRVRAAKLGVDSTNVLTKTGGIATPWQDSLIQRLHKIALEVRHNHVLPDRPLPVFEEGPTVPPALTFQVKLRDSGVVLVGKDRRPAYLTEEQFKLLWELASANNQPVSQETLCTAAFEVCLSDQSQKRLDTTINNLRRTLGRLLYGTPSGDRRMRWVIENVESGAYVLHARVAILQ